MTTHVRRKGGRSCGFFANFECAKATLSALPRGQMTLIARRHLIGSSLIAAGLFAPAIIRAAEETMVSKGVYWKHVPCQRDHVYSKHLVPDRWFLELYAPPEQSWSVAYPDGSTSTAAPWG